MGCRDSDGPAAVRYAASWSTVSQGDMGLKAGIRDPTGHLTFRPILGWVTVTERKLGTEEVSNQLHPLLLNEVGYPTLGMFIQGCVGVFPKEMTDAQAAEFSKQWTERNTLQGLANVMAN
jgi:hypothetical protein